MPTPKLNKLFWLKNVNPKDTDEDWAYEGLPLADNFNLHWPTQAKSNAERAEIGDIILLIQFTCVTHLVEVVGDVKSTNSKKHKWVREVKPLWSGVEVTPTTEKGSDDVLGFKYRCRDGQVISIQSCKGFARRWKGGGLSGLHDHVSKRLFGAP